MKTIAVLCLVAAPFVFLVGCMMGLTHGDEAQGETVINVSYGIAAIGLVSGGIVLFRSWHPTD
jgi:hypothetical protein